MRASSSPSARARTPLTSPETSPEKRSGCPRRGASNSNSSFSGRRLPQHLQDGGQSVQGLPLRLSQKRSPSAAAVHQRADCRSTCRAVGQSVLGLWLRALRVWGTCSTMMMLACLLVCAALLMDAGCSCWVLMQAVVQHTFSNINAVLAYIARQCWPGDAIAFVCTKGRTALAQSA